MSSSADNILSWIQDNWLILLAGVVLGAFPLISLDTTYFTFVEVTFLEAVFAALVVDVVLLTVFQRERRRWIDKYRYRGSFLIVGGFLLFIGTLTSLLALQTSIIVASLIGALIPGIYYTYNDIVMRPSIQIKALDLEDANIAPMYFNGLPHIARPAIFLKLEVENTGHATAEDCTIKFWYEGDGDVISSYARWAIPEADERYNLLPDESLSIHILKIFLTKDFFLLDDERVGDISRALDDHNNLSDLANRRVVFEGNPNGRIRIDEDIRGDDLEINDIADQTCFYYPTRKPPEKRESVRGGWDGNEIESGEYTLKIQPLAENYKKPRETLAIKNTEDNTLQLSVDEVAKLLIDETITWRDQWIEKGYNDFKDRVTESCQGMVT